MSNLAIGDIVVCRNENGTFERVGSIQRILWASQKVYFVQFNDGMGASPNSFYHHELTKTYSLYEMRDQINIMAAL